MDNVNYVKYFNSYVMPTCLKEGTFAEIKINSF